MKYRHHIIISIFALISLLTLGHFKKAEINRSIRWIERQLTWDDFPVIMNIPGDFHAMVYSDIQFEGDRNDGFLNIYARMIPHKSGRVMFGDSKSDQLLIHEQNHFNITEYHARLFRKEVLAIGLKELTNEDLQTLGKKYMRLQNQMQDLYDKESQHNTMHSKQRYWELHIADLLRETALYVEEDLYKYHNFIGGPTDWYRKVYLTMDGELLPSYPDSKYNNQYGEIYKVQRHKDSIVVTFYKDGKIQVGGYFKAPVSIITHPSSNIQEQHLYDENGLYFTSNATVPVLRTTTDSLGNTSTTYYNGKGDQISRDSTFIKIGEWNAERKSFYLTFYNASGERITNHGIYHQLREMDNNKVTRRVSYFDRTGKPMHDEDFVSVYEYQINSQFAVIGVKLLDVNGKPAYTNDGYRSQFEYDDRGNISTVRYLNETGAEASNENGIHKITYVRDVYDKVTDVKTFNIKGIPTNATNEYHHEVTLYDSTGRTQFQAFYLPNYVLYFNDKNEGAKAYEYVGDSIVNIRNLEVYGDKMNNTHGISQIKQILNSKKEIIEEHYFDKEGNWAKTSDGITSHKYKYDQRGNQIEKRTFDSIGKPKSFEDNVAISRWVYDMRNNKIQTSYFTEEDMPASGSQDVAIKFFKYDQNNNLSERSFFNKNKEPILYDGVHRETFLTNRFGRDSIIKYYGINNQLLQDRPYVKLTYNDYGIWIAQAHFDQNDKPTLNEDGIHKIVYKYNKQLWYTGYEHFGIHGKAMNSLEGMSQAVFDLNASGHLRTLSYFDKDENPVLGPEGYHSLYRHYNDMDEVVRSSTYGINGNMVVNSEGIADYVLTVNSNGQITRISYYDAEANLVEDSNGVAEYYYKESLNALYYLDKQLDAKGEEVLNTDS